MVAPEDSQQATHHSSDNSGTFGKLKQTISSSLLTAQDKGKEVSSFFYISDDSNSIVLVLNMRLTRNLNLTAVNGASFDIAK